MSALFVSTLFFYFFFCQENFMKNLLGKFHETCAKIVSALFVSTLFLCKNYVCTFCVYFLFFFFFQENFMQKACQCLALLSTAWQCLALLSTSGLVSGGARGAIPQNFRIFLFLSGKFHEKFVRKFHAESMPVPC